MGRISCSSNPTLTLNNTWYTFTPIHLWGCLSHEPVAPVAYQVILEPGIGQLR